MLQGNRKEEEVEDDHDSDDDKGMRMIDGIIN